MTDYRSPLSAASLSTPGVPIAYPLDDARERAIRLLTDGYAYDVISEEEFEWRLGQLSHADSPRAIDALVADLAVPAHEPANVTGSSAALVPTEGRIVGIMSQTRRMGPWRLPQTLRVKAVMSEVKIDLRYAAIPPSCTIDVTAIMANVAFIVPPSLVVDFDVTSIMSSARNHARTVDGSGYVLPHVRIRGTAIMSEVRVRVRELGR